MFQEGFDYVPTDFIAAEEIEAGSVFLVSGICFQLIAAEIVSKIKYLKRLKAPSSHEIPLEAVANN